MKRIGIAFLFSTCLLLSCGNGTSTVDTPAIDSQLTPDVVEDSAHRIIDRANEKLGDSLLQTDSTTLPSKH